MRIWRFASLAALAALACCRDKSGFDERFANRSADLETSANAMQRQLADRLNAAAAAGQEEASQSMHDAGAK